MPFIKVHNTATLIIWKGLCSLALILRALVGTTAAEPERAYRNHDREWVVADPADHASGAKTVLPTRKGINLSYTIAHDDAGTGFGFDDPTYGAARLATVDAVLAYIDSVILDTGNLRVEFERSVNDPMSNTLASASTYYPTSPFGFEPGDAFKHITTGVDPSGTFPDIVSTVDFGGSWNSETDDPAPGEIDLYSVILHEFTHGMGIAGLANPNGTSAVTGGSPGVFTTYDRFLFTGNGFNLWVAGGIFNGVPLDLLGADGGMVFKGENATFFHGSNPLVFTPPAWNPGSSVSHWTPSISGAVMGPGIGPGQKKRQWAPFEIGALRDLGYNVVPPPPPVIASAVASWDLYD